MSHRCSIVFVEESREVSSLKSFAFAPVHDYFSVAFHSQPHFGNGVRLTLRVIVFVCFFPGSSRLCGCILLFVLVQIRTSHG